MDSARWERVQAIFHAVADLEEPARSAELAIRCAGDTDLVGEVRAMLDADRGGDPLLVGGLHDLVGRVVGDADGGTPRRIGQYALHELVGEGGMGVVYRAERADLERVVAIKILRDPWVSPERRERFAAEQRTLARLNHACIARLYDAGTLPDGLPWFAMEFVDGLPFTRHCEERGLDARRRIELYRQVCEAVLHAHQHAVLHRDLKPSNILVTHGGQPKLLDFGIAKPLDEDVERTRAGFRLLTPAYAAPEQLRGDPLGVHTDVYSLGAILYELLTGSPPFELEGRSAGEIEAIVTTRDAERPSVRVKRSTGGDGPRRGVLPGDRSAEWSELDVLCATAMQKDPGRRYRSVDSLIRDVDHYLRGEPLEARPDSATYRLGKFARRNWRPLAVAAAVFLGVVGLVTYYPARVTAARNVALAEAERTRRIQGFMNGLFEGGEEEVGPADTLRVVSLLGRGVHEARALTGDPDIQASLFQTLGGIYQSRGDLARADSLLAASLAIQRRRSGPGSTDAALALASLALVRADASRFAEAESLARGAVAIGDRHAATDPAAHARTTAALGRVLVAAGEYDEAGHVLREAVRLDSLAALPARDVTETLTDLANAEFYAGHYALADSLNQRILTMDRQLYGARHPHVASDLINLGAVRQEAGEWAKAENDYRQALEIYRGWYGEDHFETAAALSMVGRTLVQQGRLAEARAPLAQALAVREHVYGPDHPSVASTLNELGLLAQRDGRLADAETAFRREVTIYRTAFHDRHYLIGLALSNLAGVRIDRGDFAEGERFYREALRRYAETLPPGHLYHGIAHLKLGRALLKARRFDEALKETLAGFDVVSHQSEPAPRWLSMAHTDLGQEYDALGRRAEAAHAREQAKQDEAAQTGS